MAGRQGNEPVQIRMGLVLPQSEPIARPAEESVDRTRDGQAAHEREGGTLDRLAVEDDKVGCHRGEAARRISRSPRCAYADVDDILQTE